MLANVRMRAAERGDALLNPILVKEIHQGFRGRGLLVGTGAALVFCLAAFTHTALSDHASGDRLFEVLNICMAVIAWVIVPVGAGHQLQKEIGDGTFELLAVTGLSPGRNISGRVQAAALKTLTLFALMAPFAVVTVLLGGVGFGKVLISISFELIVAMSLCAIALALGAAASLRSPLIKVTLGALLLGFQLLGYWVASSMLPALLRLSSLETTITWLGWGAVISVAVSALFIRSAADLLTPIGARSYAPGKVLLVTILVIASAPVLLQRPFAIQQVGVREGIFFLMLGLTGAFGLLWSGTRVEQLTPPAGFARIFGRGFGPTMLFVALADVFLFAVSSAAGLDDAAPILAAVGGCYFLVIAGISRLAQRLLDPRGTSALVYPLTFICCMVLVIFANALHMELVGHPDGGFEALAFPGHLLSDYELFWEIGAVLLVVPFALGAGYAWLSINSARRQSVTG